MKKIKIIDLLCLISNGEEVPKEIKWEDTIYGYSDYDKDYLEFPFSKDEYKGLFDMKDSILTQYLNDEVEILDDEEDKDIPLIPDYELYKINEYELLHGKSKAEKADWNFRILKEKINQVVEEFNEYRKENE